MKKDALVAVAIASLAISSNLMAAPVKLVCTDRQGVSTYYTVDPSAKTAMEEKAECKYFDYKDDSFHFNCPKDDPKSSITINRSTGVYKELTAGGRIEITQQCEAAKQKF